MDDPFLRSHAVNDRTFSVAARLAPVSIRDQVVRGWMFVNRALEQGLIRPNDELPLLIVGAGVTGIAAAMRAAMQGVSCLIIDKDTQPFITQRRCITRRVCPTQYDWPVDHFNLGRCPLPPMSPAVALSWNRGIAAQLAVEWEAQLQRAQKQYPGLIDVLWHTRLEPDPLTLLPDRVLVAVKRPASFVLGRPSLLMRVHDLPARIVLIAFGFGKERCFAEVLGQHSQARGIPFWENDPFDHPDMGVSSGKPRVLISGSGDGALQDFLRATVQPVANGELYARDIYDRCGLANRKRKDVEHTIHSAQEHAQRAYIWGGNARHDHDPLMAVHKTYNDLVDGLVDDDAIEASVCKMLRDPLPQIRLVYPCQHFGSCYGLNRFLVLLVAKVIEKNWQPVLFPGRGVSEIFSVEKPHVCQQRAHNPSGQIPQACHGWLHQVAVREFPDCRNDWQQPASWGDEEAAFYKANVLILRHGVALTDPEKRLSPAQARQLLPYALVR